MLRGYSPLVQAIFATLFTWLVTAVGAACVFLVPRSLTYRRQRQVLDAALGFAGGVMLAASYWSLLAPALEFAEASGYYGAHSYIPVAVGIVLGSAFVYIADRLIPHESGDAVSVLSEQKRDAGADDGEERKETNDDTTVEMQEFETRKVEEKQEKEKESVDEPEEEQEEKTSPSPPTIKKKSTIRQRASSKTDESAPASKPAATDASTKLAATAADEVDLTPPSTEAQQKQLEADTERIQTWHRILLLVIAIVIHNFPEGLAVGVGFGALSTISSPDMPEDIMFNPHSNATYHTELAEYEEKRESMFLEARSLAIGIGLQNFPEGLAVSLPLMRVGYSRTKAFWYGQLSGMVEPFGGALGAALISIMEPILPYALAFAAGAMVFVVTHDLIPETRTPGGFPDLATWFVVVGFIVMMSLDVGLG